MLRMFFHPFVFLTGVPYSPLNHYFPRLAIPREEVTLRTDDGLRLSAWLLRAEEPQGYLLYLRGNGGKLSDWAPHAAAFAAMGQNVLLLDYRGYGESQGRPSESGLYRDGEAAWRWMSRRAREEGLLATMLGKSMGTAVAAHVAVKYANDEEAPDGLILDSPLTSMRETIALRAKWLPRVLIPRFFETESFARDVRCPTLVVHGARDGVAPIRFARRLFGQLRCPKIMVEVPGATHGSLATERAYLDAAREFLADPTSAVETFNSRSTDAVPAAAESERLRVG